MDVPVTRTDAMDKTDPAVMDVLGGKVERAVMDGPVGKPARVDIVVQGETIESRVPSIPGENTVNLIDVVEPIFATISRDCCVQKCAGNRDVPVYFMLNHSTCPMAGQ